MHATGRHNVVVPTIFLGPAVPTDKLWRLGPCPISTCGMQSQPHPKLTAKQRMAS